ncbi:hypothetical protein AVEN_88278-1 [Araneus ventricosus]|uniref:DUF4371 domain-containing protein n=1 Tax=Araneus ventricosus TaxID=182803 RepID=A0A4Y2EQB8_ARAVE|nr:hypothetical protein AVEN_88278-1 [Araneus ventricosus]
MPRQTKYQEDWLSLTDPTGNEISFWCDKGKDDFHCFCRFCKKDIAICNSGKLQLFQHANSAKHKKSVKDATDLSQSKLKMISTANGDRGLCLDKTTASSSSMTQWNFNEEEKIISAEILYILHAAVNNISFSSFDGISQLFSRMFPKGEEAKGMKFSSRKVAYEISHGLGPYFLAKISKSIQSCSFFTLLFDETLNESNKRQLDIHVRFWNCELNAIQQSYVGSEMLFHATASDIDSAIMTCMKKANLPIKKLLMLGSDGPNVNKAVFKIFDHRLKSEVGEGLVNVGTCNLHIVHNAFGEGLQLDAFASIIYFLEDIDIWFRKYPSRKEDLIISSQCVDEEVVCNTLRYVSNRWLSVVPSCQRILKMYPALKQHFLVDLVGNKSDLIKTEWYKRIRSALKSHLTPAYLHFLVSVGKIFDNFLRFLQSDKTLIHLLYDEMSNIVRKLLFRFISMESCQEKKDEDLLEIPLKSIMEKENLKYLDVGHEANKILSSIEAAAKRCFKLDAQNFYFSVTSCLLKTNC